jgi:hypothetical protein
MILRIALLLALTLGAACQKKPTAQARDVLTRNLIKSVQAPMLLADFPAKTTSFTLRQYSRNQSIQTWKSGDGVSLSFDRGVLVATRGLGDDLMSSDATKTVQMLSGNTGSEYYPRFQTYLDGEYQSQFRTFQCKRSGAHSETIEIFDISHNTTRIEETCYSPGFEITNIFWRGSDGMLWKSKQWISPSLNYLVTERLVK